MEYLQEYASVMTKEEKKVCYCRNMAVDAVIHFYAGELKQRGILFECDMMLLPISAFQIRIYVRFTEIFWRMLWMR